MSVTTAGKPFARHTTTKTRRSALAVLVIAALAAAAGCSSSSSSPPSGSSGSGSGSGAAPDAAVATATSLLNQASSSAVTGPSFGPLTTKQIVPWAASMMPTPSALPKGKKITVDIVFGLAVGEGPYIAKLTAALAGKLGWTAKVIQASAQSQPATLSAFQQAVNDKPTAIIAFVVPGVWVGGALAQAKKQGIFTIDVHQDSSDGPGYDAWVPDAEGVQKSLMAAYAVKSGAGAPSSLLFDAPGFSDVNIPAAASYLKQCGSCTTQSVQINPEDFIDPVKMQSDVTSILAAHQGTDYLVWPNAALPVSPVIAAIRSSTSPDAKLLLNGPNPAADSLVKSGAVPLMVQSPDALLVLTALDDVSRLVQGKPAVAQDALRLPISYWTPSNVPGGTDFSTIAKAQLANDFLSPYEKAWGVDLRSVILAAKS